MVVVRMGDQEQIGFGQPGVVGIFRNGVDVDPVFADLDGQRGVAEEVQHDLRAVTRGQGVGGVDGGVVVAVEE